MRFRGLGLRRHAGLIAGQRRYVGLTTLVALVAALVIVPLALAGAINTTTDSGQIVNTKTTGVCLNGPDPSVNCNLYSQKEDVFLSGSPTAASLATGTYYFAVLDPGGQPDPNPGAAKVLSYDASVQDREFSVTDSANGTISYPVTGSHVFDSTNNKLSVWPYHDTTNNGGVYILAVCKISDSVDAYTDSVSVDPRDCKYDAFKVKNTTTPPVGTASNLDISKTAIAAFDRNYGWDMAKSVDKTKVEQIGGNATFTYTVTATWRSLGDSGWDLSGAITVTNPNTQDVTGVTIGDVVSYGAGSTTDASANCKAYDSGTSAYDLSFPLTNQTVTSAGLTINYDCAYTAAPADTLETNTASVSWGTQCLEYNVAGDPTSGCKTNLPGTTDPITYPVPFTWDDPTLVNDTSTLTDTFGLSGQTGTAYVLGLAGIDGSWVKDAGNTLWDSSHNLTPYDGTTQTFTFVYSRSIAVPAHGCLNYTNTVTESTGTSPDPDNTIDTRTVTVCGPAATGALTIGFWKTTNGQNLIKNYCSNGSALLRTYLIGLGAGSGPFSNAPSGCTALATYVSGILTGANAKNMNTMLKAQMLATALDVWFSGPGWTGTTVNKIKPPSTFLSHNNLGTFNMETTAVCPMVDNLSTGSATCKNNTPSTDAVAAGAVPTSPMSMQAILDFASTTPAPFNGSVSTPTWYGGNTTKEEILKNIFDQFNNGDAFGSF